MTFNAQNIADNYIVAISQGCSPDLLPCADMVDNYYGHTGYVVQESGAIRSEYIADMGRQMQKILSNYRVENPEVEVVSEEIAYVRLTICGNLADGTEIRAPQCVRWQVKYGKIVRTEGYIDRGVFAPIAAALGELQRRGQAVQSDLTFLVK